MHHNRNYSIVSDLAGVLFWAAVFLGYTMPIWSPILAFLLGMFLTSSAG